MASSQQQAGHRAEGRHPINSLLIWKQTEEGWTSLLLLMRETATVCRTLTTAGIGRFLQLPSLLFFFPSSPSSTQPPSFPEGSHIAQDSLQLFRQLRMTSNSRSSCFYLLDSGITVCPTMPVFCSELPSPIFGPGGQEKMWGASCMLVKHCSNCAVVSVTPKSPLMRVMGVISGTGHDATFQVIQAAWGCGREPGHASVLCN